MNIIITGASRGIGFDTALALAENPNNTIWVLSRNEEKLKALQQAAKHGNIHYQTLDLTAIDEQTISEVAAKLGQVDALINNAGLLINKPFLELTDEDWQRLFAVNVFGVAKLVRLLVPFLEKSEKAHVLNIGSMGGFQGSAKFPGLSAYSASKAALANLTECLAEELKDKNISVNCIALGAVQTEMLNEAFPGYQAPVTSQQMANYLAYFSLNGHHFQNGKVIPLSVSTP